MSDEEIDDEIAKLDLRERKCRVVNFEMTGRNAFSVSTNFTCPDQIVNILKQFNALWNKKRREWTANILKYREALVEIQNFCKPRGIYVDMIPAYVFELSEYNIPFTDESK